MSIPRIPIHGCYTTRNFGDILLLDLLARHIVEHYEVRAICPWLHPAEHGRLHAEGGRGLRSLLPARAAVYGGGGYFADSGRNEGASVIQRIVLPAKVWRLARVPYCVVGVGAGPALSPLSGRRLRRFVEGAERVAVRDEESLQVLLGHGVPRGKLEVTADLVLGMRREEIPAAAMVAAEKLLGPRVPGRRRLGLHLEFSPPVEEKIAPVAEAVAKGLAGAEEEVEVIWFRDHGDYRAAAEQVGRRFLPNSRYVAGDGHWETASIIAQLDGVITAKLHVGIAAWALGVPPCGYSFHPKTKRVYRQMGRSHFQIDRGADPERIVEWARTFARDPAAFAAEDPEARRELPRLAARNLEIVDELLRPRVPARR